MLQNTKNMYLRQSLVNMAYSKPATKAPVKAKALQPNQLSDQTVLEIRALHKFTKATVNEIAERYQVKPGTVKALISYHSRLALEPTRDNLPC